MGNKITIVDHTDEVKYVYGMFIEEIHINNALLRARELAALQHNQELQDKEQELKERDAETRCANFQYHFKQHL